MQQEMMDYQLWFIHCVCLDVRDSELPVMVASMMLDDFFDRHVRALQALIVRE